MIRLGRRGYLLAVLRQDVMVGSRGLGRRECRLDTGSKIDLKNLRDSDASCYRIYLNPWLQPTLSQSGTHLLQRQISLESICYGYQVFALMMIMMTMMMVKS